MSLGAFPPLEFYEIVWEEVLVILGMFGKIPLWSHPVQGFCLLGVILIITSTSLCVICLFRFSYSSWFSFGRWYISRNVSISSRCPVCWHIVVHNIFLQSFVFLWCQLLFLLFHFWFYLFGYFLFFSWWVWFVNLVYIFKEPALGFIDLLYLFF